MNTVQIPQRRRGTNRLNAVALTALLTLREALTAENYEICQQVIDIALEFGATQADVFTLLEDIRRNPVVYTAKAA